MLDQADHLRLLMRGAGRDCPGDGAPRPRQLVVAGAKGGVGTTTIAVNIAVALACQGHRALLVDGDLGKADAAALCGTREGYTIGDVLAGRRSIEVAAQHGPAGVRVLPGAWATGHVTDCDPVAQNRLIGELSTLRNTDHVVIDAGCGVNRLVERFWMSADRVLLVTSPDSTSVIDAYATLKTVGSQHAVPVQVVMNKSGDSESRAAWSRLADVCRRFLSLELNCAASIPVLHEIAAAGQQRTPFVLSSHGSRASQSVADLARTTLKPKENHETIHLIHVA